MLSASRRHQLLTKLASAFRKVPGSATGKWAPPGRERKFSSETVKRMAVGGKRATNIPLVPGAVSRRDNKRLLPGSE